MRSLPFLTLEHLLSLAGLSIYERGLTYFEDGLVTRLNTSADRAWARVEGSEAYQVELAWLGDGLDYSCTCPHAMEGHFCKHVVAVGLAWVNAQESGQRECDPWQEIRDWLALQPQCELAALLCEIAQRDDALYRSLRLKVERAKCSDDQGNSGEVWQRAIDEATEIPEFLDWRAVTGYATDLQDLTDALEGLLTTESAGLLIELSEYAIQRTEQALQQADDSNGELGEVLGRLNHLHLQACLLAKPDPIALAERLFHLETSADFDSFHDSAKHYQEVLGNIGLQRFRELAQAEWSQVPALAASQRGSYDGKRWHITHIMETLAELSGDLEALVAVKERDLSSAYHYLGIAELYQAAGKPEMALDWAERGLSAFPRKTDSRLRDFLAEYYLICGRHEQALQLTWVQFDESPSLANYQKLQRLAQRLECAPVQRLRALERLAEVPGNNPLLLASAHSLRLAIALWEEDLDAAWQVSQQGDCNEGLLHELAHKLEASRPQDAITLYRRMLAPIIQQTNNQAYERAIRLMRRMGELMRAENLTAAFTDELQKLRQRYKAKRNFIKLLDGLLRD